MNILNLIPELIEDSILLLLEWNDLLRLRRRTCMTFKNLVQVYMRKHAELAPELEINEENKNLQVFLAMGIPTKQLFLNNVCIGRMCEWMPENVAKFLKEYGSKVTNLRVTIFTLYCGEEETRFLNGLVNLQSLEAEYLRNSTPGQIPEIFGTLRVLKASRTFSNRTAEVVAMLELILQRCNKLEELSIPNLSVYTRFEQNEVLAQLLNSLSSAIQERNGGFKRIDCLGMKSQYWSYLSEEEVQTAFLQFCRCCVVHNIKLLNIQEEWFCNPVIKSLPDVERYNLGTPLVSLNSIGIANRVQDLDMRNLEKLEISWHHGTSFPPGRGEQPLANLRSVTLKGYLAGAVSNCQRFIARTQLQNLVELELDSYWGFELDSVLGEAIVKSCPNVTRLALKNLSGSSEGLLRLWAGLSKLEEVALRSCRDLDNASFIGPDTESPVFLNLRNLKKLTLEPLCQMPKITDDLFFNVIRHMRLTTLNLVSNKLVENVTLNGVMSLLNGPFSESIERFPFQKWALKGIYQQKFEALEKKFRSSDML